MTKVRRLMFMGACAVACFVGIPSPEAGPANTRLTNDNSSYVSDYTLVTGNAYTDDVLTACSQSRGRQNEPAVAVHPRNTQVIVGSPNDYCGVFAANGTPIGNGIVGSEPAGRLPRQDRDRGRPHRRRLRRQRLLRLGALHRKQPERLQLERLLQPLDR